MRIGAFPDPHPVCDHMTDDGLCQSMGELRALMASCSA